MSNVKTIIGILAARIAEAGTAIQGIQSARNWTALASGNFTHLLNQIGKIAGMPRWIGLSDAAYVQYVRAAIAADRSSGRVEDLYSIARLLLPAAIGLSIEEYYPASFILEVTDTVGLIGANGAAWTDPYALAAGADGAGSAPFGDGNSGSLAINALEYFMRRAKPAAVWQVTQYGLSPDADLFTLDSGPGLDQGNFAGWQGP